jgi:Putative DNA-binding domain
MSLPGRHGPRRGLLESLGEYRSAQHEGIPVNALTEQQRALKHAIVGPPHHTAHLLRADTGREPLLRIYRQAYTVRLIGALRDNFGVLPLVLGDEAFDALALAYIEAHPSQRPSIRWFGEWLPEFMAGHDGLVPHPAMTDLARMEWALRAAFDAADASPIDATALAGVPGDAWPSLVLEPLPSVQLLAMGWNVEPVWRALKDADPNTAPELPEPQAHEHTLLVWRQGLETRWRSLDRMGARLLAAALAGETFGALCEVAAADVGEAQAALQAAGVLRHWLDEGLISGWRLAPNRAGI